jgi:spermidine synthase
MNGWAESQSSSRAARVKPTISVSPQRGVSILRVLPILFFLSGATSLTFETLFTRLLTYTFGNTAHAVSTVLAAFLGGLALGAFVIGRWADRRPPSLWIYGVLELLAAVYCLFTPQLFAGLTKAYVLMHHHLQLGPVALNVVRFSLSTAVIIVPTILMGGTLPVLARLVASLRHDFEPVIDRLYAWNTFGAATGTLLATYLLMPQLGVKGTLWLACGANGAIFLGAASLASRSGSAVWSETTAPSPSAPAQEESAVPASTVFLLVGAFLTGAVSLAYEVVWTHVLAFLIGNTVYAFGVMLFTFLCGLGWGARIVARHVRRADHWARWLAASQLFLGISIYLTVPLWGWVPGLFAQGLVNIADFNLIGIGLLVLIRMVYVGWKIYRFPFRGDLPWSRFAELAIEILLIVILLNANRPSLWQHEATYFVTAELFRFFCAFYLLIVPSLLLGMSFPLLLNIASHAAREVGSRVGSVYAANTLGTVLGSVLTGFVILPWLGSLATLRAAASVNLLLGLGFGLFGVALRRSRKYVLGVVALSLVVLVWLGPGGWDARRMTRGSYVYFNQGWPIDRVLYLQEDVQGGMTSVIEAGQTRVMLSNGKFQGNNTGEVGAQIRFALAPVLFTSHFDRALVIGLGTGNTLRTLTHFPFLQIDAIELAPHIIDAARRWFQDVNQLVFDRDPRVRLSVTDGRNFLLLSREQYNLITIEVSSIWISGEADLYNKEFYELCRARLAPDGILQQWVQIHHMRPQDFLVILNTAAQVFPHAALFLGPEQGLLIASASPLGVDYRQLAKLDAEPGVRRELDVLGAPSLFTLLGEMALYGDSLLQAVSNLPRLSGLPADFASTDFRPYLEYQTPKGNTVPYDTVPMNVQLVEGLRGPLIPVDMPIRNLPSENERNLIRGFVAEGRGDVAGAIGYLGRVEGEARERAQGEITRLKSQAPVAAR